MIIKVLMFYETNQLESFEMILVQILEALELGGVTDGEMDNFTSTESFCSMRYREFYNEGIIELPGQVIKAYCVQDTVSLVFPHKGDVVFKVKLQIDGFYSLNREPLCMFDNPFLIINGKNLHEGIPQLACA